MTALYDEALRVTAFAAAESVTRVRRCGGGCREVDQDSERGSGAAR
jgi:hypothetical protein